MLRSRAYDHHAGRWLPLHTRPTSDAAAAGLRRHAAPLFGGDGAPWYRPERLLAPLVRAGFRAAEPPSLLVQSRRGG